MAQRSKLDQDTIEIQIPCKAEYVRTIRRAIAEFALSMDMPGAAVEEVEIAASEALANVIRHAYAGSDASPPIRVRCGHDRDGLVLEIIDKGCGFNAPAYGVIPEVDPDKEGGLGIVLIKHFMDHVRYFSKPGAGTRIKMTKHVNNGKLETALPAPELAGANGAR